MQQLWRFTCRTRKCLAWFRLNMQVTLAVWLRCLMMSSIHMIWFSDSVDPSNPWVKHNCNRCNAKSYVNAQRIAMAQQRRLSRACNRWNNISFLVLILIHRLWIILPKCTTLGDQLPGLSSIASLRQTMDFYPGIHCPQINAKCCLTMTCMRQPVGAVYLRIFNRPIHERWAARQLLFVMDNAGVGDMPHFRNNRLSCRSIYHCVGDVIMPARSSNSSSMSSRYVLSAMYPGVVVCSLT
jgi:hypothetical protein